MCLPFLTQRKNCRKRGGRCMRPLATVKMQSSPFTRKRWVGWALWEVECTCTCVRVFSNVRVCACVSVYVVCGTQNWDPAGGSLCSALEWEWDVSARAIVLASYVLVYLICQSGSHADVISERSPSEPTVEQEYNSPDHCGPSHGSWSYLWHTRGGGWGTSHLVFQVWKRRYSHVCVLK